MVTNCVPAIWRAAFAITPRALNRKEMVPAFGSLLPATGSAAGGGSECRK